MSTLAIGREIKRVEQLARGMIWRALVKVANSAAMKLEVDLTGQVLPEVEHSEAYGFASHPPKGSSGVWLAPMGHRSDGVVMNVNDPAARPTDLNEGDACVWNRNGVVIYLRDDKTIEVVGATNVIVNGDVKLGGGDAEKGVAREGDEIDCGYIVVQAAAPGSPCLITLFPPGTPEEILLANPGVKALSGVVKNASSQVRSK